jgi:single-strand DNA-binding protein
MSYEAEGKLHKKLEVQQVTDSFKKREFVIEMEDGAYSQLIKFQLTQAHCDKLDAFKEGGPIKVTFSIKGREYTKDGKTSYFTNLEAWRLDVPGKQASAPAATAVASGGSFPSVADAPSAPDDDLPF